MHYIIQPAKIRQASDSAILTFAKKSNPLIIRQRGERVRIRG